MSVRPWKKIITGAAVLLLTSAFTGTLHAQVEKHGWPEFPPNGLVRTMTTTDLSPDGEVLYRDIKEFSPDGKLQKTTYYGYRGEYRGSAEETYDSKGLRISTRTVFPEYNRELITKYRTDASGNLTESVQYFLEGDVASRFSWEWSSPGLLKSVKVFTPEGELFFSLEYTLGRPGFRDGFVYRSGSSGEGQQKLSYDSLGRLEAEPFFNADGGLFFLKYTYDSRGMVVREDVISSGGDLDAWIVYTRDSRGNVVESRKYAGADFLVQTRKVELVYRP